MTHSISPFPPALVLVLSMAIGNQAAARGQEGTGANSTASSPAAVEVERLRADIESLKTGQEAIQKDLAEIKAMLRDAPAARQPERPPAVPANATIDLGSRPTKGSSSAKLAVIEFSDYQCPYCARFVRDTYPRLEQEFIAKGKIRYAMLDFPLRNHPFAFKAAEAVTCAAADGKFWEMHHLLFEQQHALQPDALPAYAEQIGLDRAAFETCLQEGRQEDVNADMTLARQAGVSATPSFLVGWIEDDGKVTVKQMIRGAQPYENFERVLTQMLDEGPSAGNGE